MSLEILNNPLIGNSFNKVLGGNSPNDTIVKTPVLQSPTELKQKTSKQIANTYYNGKPIAQSTGFQIYSDDPILEGNIEEVTIYTSRFAQTINGIDVVLFASKNGAFLLQRYMEALPQSNELILFLEINDEFNFHTVFRAVAGDNLTDRKDIPFADIINFTRKHEITINPKNLQELIQKGIYRNKVSLISWFLNLKDASVAKIFNYFTHGILKDAEKAFNEIGDGISGLKISENGWNPSQKEGEYNPTFIPEVLYKELTKFYEHTSSKNPYENLQGQKKINSKILKTLFEEIDKVKDFFKDKLKETKSIIPDYIYNRLNKAIDFFFNQLNKIESFLADPLTGMQHIIYKSYQITNALLCGIYNSIIDIIAGFFYIIGLIFRAVLEMKNISDNKVLYGEMLLELMEDMIEGIITFNYADFLFECLTFQIRNIIRLIKWVEKKAPLFSLEKAAYYFGYIIGIIVDIIVETLISGGTAAVAKLAKNIESFLLNPIEKISKGIEKTVTFTKGLLTKVLEFLQMVIREFKKGAKELFAKFNKFLDEVFGLGEDVASTPKTRAEERWNKKRQRIKDKKANPAKTKRIKQHEEFVERWSGRSIKTLTKIEIANSLKGFTEQGNKIAKLIEDGEMLFEILNEKTFKMAYLESGGKLSNYNKYRIEAFSYGDINYFREDKSIESFMSELIHEGTHTLDYLEEQRLWELGKSEAEIDKILGDIYSFEKRAYFHERAFQIATEMDVEYKTIESMLEHIFYTYP